MARRWRTVAVAVAWVVAITVGAGPAAADEHDPVETAEELRAAKQERAGLDAALKRKITDLTAAREELVAIRQQLASARARSNRTEGLVQLGEEALAEARQRLAAARKELAEAEQQLVAAANELDRQERSLADQAASAYKYGSVNTSETWLRIVRESSTPNELARSVYQLRSAVDYQDDVVQRVMALRAQRERLREAAATRQVIAKQREAEAATALEVVTTQRAEARAIAAQIKTAEERQEAILASLEADAEAIGALMAEVDASYEELAARLAAEREADRAEQVASGFTTHCPVRGARVDQDFVNDWGYPRSGGRTHEGLDIFAQRGTEIVAMFEGTVKEVRTVDVGLGGKVVSYWVAPGEYWYHAHLDAVAPGLKAGDPVAPGQVIGTVGNTGNAASTPSHLHIGKYVGGDARPPYPLVSVACF